MYECMNVIVAGDQFLLWRKLCFNKDLFILHSIFVIVALYILDVILLMKHKKGILPYRKCTEHFYSTGLIIVNVSTITL